MRLVRQPLETWRWNHGIDDCENGRLILAQELTNRALPTGWSLDTVRSHGGGGDKRAARLAIRLADVVSGQERLVTWVVRCGSTTDEANKDWESLRSKRNAMNKTK